MPIAHRDHYPDNMTDWDFERAGITRREPAEAPSGTVLRVRAMLSAVRDLRYACERLISEGEDDIIIAGLCPSDVMPDGDLLTADIDAALTDWAEEQAGRARECDEERAADLWREDRA